MRRALILLAASALAVVATATPPAAPPARAWNLLVECCHAWPSDSNPCCDRSNPGMWPDPIAPPQEPAATVGDPDGGEYRPAPKSGPVRAEPDEYDYGRDRHGWGDGESNG